MEILLLVSSIRTLCWRSVAKLWLTLQPRGLQCARLLCPSLTLRACSNSCPLESVNPSNHLILCGPLLLLPSIFPSIRIFSNESALRIRWPKYWRFSISPSHEYSGLLSFRIDWFDLLAVQGTLKSLLQHHSSKVSSALSFLHGPTLTSTHDYWNNRCSLDRPLSAKCCLCFLILYLGLL